jgi:hypothetical protein
MNCSGGELVEIDGKMFKKFYGMSRYTRKPSRCSFFFGQPFFKINIIVFVHFIAAVKPKRSITEASKSIAPAKVTFGDACLSKKSIIDDAVYVVVL